VTETPSQPAQHHPREAVVTVVYGTHAERLDYTFSSFAQNPHLELHAFVLADRLPRNQVPGIRYHLRAPDPAFSHPMRDADYRRWVFLDELEADYALVVDGLDVLCLQPLPRIPDLLRGYWLGACVEHAGNRMLRGHLYTANFLNAGVTFWDVRKSISLRKEIVQIGRRRFRNLQDDQITLNELVHTRYFENLIILPCQYNYRALLKRRYPGWPTVSSLDSVKIYHSYLGIENAKRHQPFLPYIQLPELQADKKHISALLRWLRRINERIGLSYLLFRKD